MRHRSPTASQLVERSETIRVGDLLVVGHLLLWRRQAVAMPAVRHRGQCGDGSPRQPDSSIRLPPCAFESSGVSQPTAPGPLNARIQVLIALEHVAGYVVSRMRGRGARRTIAGSTGFLPRSAPALAGETQGHEQRPSHRRSPNSSGAPRGGASTAPRGRPSSGRRPRRGDHRSAED